MAITTIFNTIIEKRNDKTVQDKRRDKTKKLKQVFILCVVSGKLYHKH